MADHRPGDELVLPVIEEVATVDKTVVETGRVHISTRVEEHQALIHEALRHDDVVVERVEIGRAVETAPSIRQEGDTLIYPIVEEVLFVEKRLILKEELHIRRSVQVETVDREVTLRTVHADVTRTSSDDTQP